MLQEEFNMLNRARKAQFKAEQRAIAESLTSRKEAFKKRTQELLAQVTPSPMTEKKRARHAYSVQRHIKHALEAMVGTGWNTQESEVKFNNQGDLLLFEVAIPKAKEYGTSN